MDSISIKGYKSFKDITVELGKINILIGSNGAGKSNFLSLRIVRKCLYRIVGMGVVNALNTNARTLRKN